MPIRPRTPPRAAHAGLWKHWTLWVWFVLALVLCVAGVCLWKSGRWLVNEDSFEKARWGVVLAGESRDCERSDAAIRMYHEGKIDTLVISATRIFKNRYGSEYMVDYFVQQGVPRDRVFEFRQDAYSTLEEARLLLRQFRLQNLDTALIITTTYHTARTRRIFHKLSQGYPVVLVAAADYPVFDPDAFWSNRESLKFWFNEWVKTLFTWVELARAQPENGKAEYQGLTPDIWASKVSDRSMSDTAGAAGSAVLDSVKPPETAVDNSDSASAAGSKAASPDSVKSAEKAALDSAEARTDSIKVHKDSVKAYKDSVKTRAAEIKAAAKDSVKRAAEVKTAAKDSVKKAAEAKAAAKDSVVKKSLPRSPKKSPPPAKGAVKPAEKKLEKTGTRKKD